jgi:ankyrin repeat protein
MLEARRSGKDPFAGLESYTDRENVESKQRSAIVSIDAAELDLKALHSELETRHDLTPQEHDEISDRIYLDLAKCESERILLKSPISAKQLPPEFLVSLLDVHELGRHDHSLSHNGTSPMHMAAKLGRRDILEYLLTLPGGMEALAHHDQYGRTPIYHAQSEQHKALEHWLRQKLGDASMHRHDHRPALGSIPEKYERLLHQIEDKGWKSVDWKDDFTMLHWAASAGNSSLCKYLMTLDANPNATDKHRRTPIDIAREKGHHTAVQVLSAGSHRGSMRRVSEVASIYD